MIKESNNDFLVLLKGLALIKEGKNLWILISLLAAYYEENQ